MFLKNRADTVYLFAFNSSTNDGQANDAANLTVRAVGDGTEYTPAATPVQVDATNLKGVYKLALTAAEMNYNSILVGGRSATANVTIAPIIFTTDESSGLAVFGTVNDAGATAGGFIGAAGLSAIDDAYKNAYVCFTTGTLAGLKAQCTGYVGATRAFSFSTPFPAAPANGTAFEII